MFRKGIKATVVLFFFLGMSSLLFCINPRDSGIYEDAYMLTNAVLKGSQVGAEETSLCFEETLEPVLYCRAALSVFSTVYCQQM